MIKLNNCSADKKQAIYEDQMEHTRTNNVDTEDKHDIGKAVQRISSSAQAEYPLLKPVTFTNIVADDYLESGVWQLR